jgi:chromosome segregation ATPase
MSRKLWVFNPFLYKKLNISSLELTSLYESRIKNVQRPSYLGNQSFAKDFSMEINDLQQKNLKLEEKLDVVEKELLLYMEKEKKKRLEIEDLQTQLKSIEDDQKNSLEQLKLAREETNKIQSELNFSLNNKKGLKKTLNDSQNLLENTLIKLKALKTQHFKLQKFNEKLVSERQSLALRAAVGFEELTPRPNIDDILANNGLDEEKYADLIKEIKGKHCTTDVVALMLEKIGGNVQVRKKLDRKKTMDVAKTTSTPMKINKIRPSERFFPDTIKIFND